MSLLLYFPGVRVPRGLGFIPMPITVNLLRFCTIPTIIAYTVGFSCYDDYFLQCPCMYLYCIFYFVFSNKKEKRNACGVKPTFQIYYTFAVHARIELDP